METPALRDLDARFASQWVVAQSGKGKTNLLLYMILRDIERGYSVVVMDSKGELTDYIRNLALGDRLIVLDPIECPFAINPLDVSTGNLEAAISNVQYTLSGLLETSLTAMQQSFFYNLINALFHFPSPSLKTIEDLLMKGPDPYKNLIHQMPDDVQNFFFHRWESYDRTQKEIYWRLDLLLKRRSITQMFTAPKTRFDISQAMDEGKVVVIDNSQDKCGVEGCGFLGRFFVSRIWAAGTARQRKPYKHPTFCYIDEAHIVIKKDQKIADIIDQLRSQRVGLVLAHQKVRSQIDDENVRSSLENCAIKMVNHKAEADYFARLLGVPAEKINLPRGFFVMEHRDHGISVREIPKAEIPYRQMTEAEQAELKQRMIDQYGIKQESPEMEDSGHKSVRIPAEADKPIIPPKPQNSPRPQRSYPKKK